MGPGKWDPLPLGPLPGKWKPYHRRVPGTQGDGRISGPHRLRRRRGRHTSGALCWRCPPGAFSLDGSVTTKKPARAHAGEAMGEENIPTEQPEAGQAPRVPSPDVDLGRPGHPVRPPAQGSGQAVGLIWSVRDRATFQALRRSRARVRRGPITVTWVPGDPSEPPRVAYAVGRSAGGAVVRNRIRRRLRAVSREAGPLLRPGAYLVGAHAGASSLSYRELRATLCEVLATLATKEPPVTAARPPTTVAVATPAAPTPATAQVGSPPAAGPLAPC